MLVLLSSEPELLNGTISDDHSQAVLVLETPTELVSGLERSHGEVVVEAGLLELPLVAFKHPLVNLPELILDLFLHI